MARRACSALLPAGDSVLFFLEGGGGQQSKLIAFRRSRVRKVSPILYAEEFPLMTRRRRDIDMAISAGVNLIRLGRATLRPFTLAVPDLPRKLQVQRSTSW